MTMIERPNCELVLGNLKDFQRRTVDYVFQRLYTDEHPTRRFLVADEVGLGKTLVARGVIAKTVDHLWDKVKRIDIIYICSNADIARQNIRRLNIFGNFDIPISTRITLLPSVITDLKKRKVNIISLTPATSFDFKEGLGIREERALIYWMLKKEWALEGDAPINVLAGGAKPKNFKQLVNDFLHNHQIDADLKSKFIDSVNNYDQEEIINNTDLKSRFKKLCLNCSTVDYDFSVAEESERRNIISELRELLAKSCLDALEPDLIILDEFQRFKYILYGDDPSRELAEPFFNYADQNSETKVLLLSATPYKMYTLAEESNKDDHYQDFINTLGFLQNDPEEKKSCENLLTDYRRELFRISDGSISRALSLKSELEAKFRKVIARTERLSVSNDRNGMLKEMPDISIKLDTSDLIAYCKLRNITEILEVDDALEYWKSSPYLLNFMEDYELKRSFNIARRSPGKQTILYQALTNSDGLFLPWDDIAAYKKIAPRNARIRALLSKSVEAGAWKLLWIPPALPYCNLMEPFSSMQNFTKFLVFSSWRVVPKTAACLISYEAERQTITLFDHELQNNPETRKRLRGLLRFGRSSDSQRRLTGMPVFCLLYPSMTLAKECDPLRIASKNQSDLLSLDKIIITIQDRINVLLCPLLKNAIMDGAEDENWYWAAPMLLDREYYSKYTHEIFGQYDLSDEWSGFNSQDLKEDEEPSHWDEHVFEAKKLIQGRILLKKPPNDLSYVLAQIALAAPGTASLRALARVTGGLDAPLADIWKSAAKLSWQFLHLFNLPATVALIRGLGLDETKSLPYWRLILDYCSRGCLQATLDEYVHFLLEYEGLFDKDRKSIAENISYAIGEAITLRTASLDVEKIEASSEIFCEKHKMRTNFALRLADERNDENEVLTRASQVRKAFNSPFWPFVLITTSVGQEGLDFHPYCHAIIHWNLPANPVDLEQREGRIHRYKGHAIRKNLAKKYGLSVLSLDDDDPWEALFHAGIRDRPDNSGDLIPFWIYPLEDGAKIERYVPALPVSRDQLHLAELHKSLAIYRMVFGQSRQEDLIEYLTNYMTTENIEKITKELRIDLSPPCSFYE